MFWRNSERKRNKTIAAAVRRGQYVEVQPGLILLVTPQGAATGAALTGRMAKVISGGDDAMILPLLPMILPLLPVGLEFITKLYQSVAAAIHGSGETAEQQKAHLDAIATGLQQDLVRVQAVPQVYTGA